MLIPISTFLFVLILFGLLLWDKQIFTTTKTMKEIIVLKGGEFYKSMIGDEDKHFVKDPDTGEMNWGRTQITGWEKWLYDLTGVRYVGVPIIYRVGITPIYYPDNITSASPDINIHHNGNRVDALDSQHHYVLTLHSVEFQGGNKLDMKFPFEIILDRTDVAWGKQGRFLDPLGNNASSRIRQIALTTDLLVFMGKARAKASKKKKLDIQKQSQQIRDLMCSECMRLNEHAEQDQKEDKGERLEDVPIAELAGYKFLNILAGDIEVTDKLTLARIAEVERLAESELQLERAENERQKAFKDAEGKAAETKFQLEAEAYGAKKLMEAYNNNPELMHDQIITDGHVKAMERVKASTLFMTPPGRSGRRMPVQPVFNVGNAGTPAAASNTGSAPPKKPGTK